MFDTFQFKQFAVQQNSAAMKVGTDAILLGTWACSDNPAAILDIGTGTGVVALMLAQRFSSAQIHAVEISTEAAALAAANFSNSPWSDRMHVASTAVQSYQPDQPFDLIVSNPPFFSDGLKSPSAPRRFARHDDCLSLRELFDAVRRSLAGAGLFCVILPVERCDECCSAAREHALFCQRRQYVQPTPSKPPGRCLLEFAGRPCDTPVVERPLIVETARHRYSDGFAALAKDFLLKL